MILSTASSVRIFVVSTTAWMLKGDIVSICWCQGDILWIFWCQGDIVRLYWCQGDIVRIFWCQSDIVQIFWCQVDIIRMRWCWCCDSKMIIWSSKDDFTTLEWLNVDYLPGSRPDRGTCDPDCILHPEAYSSIITILKWFNGTVCDLFNSSGIVSTRHNHHHSSPVTYCQ